MELKYEGYIERKRRNMERLQRTIPTIFDTCRPRADVGMFTGMDRPPIRHIRRAAPDAAATPTHRGTEGYSLVRPR